MTSEILDRDSAFSYLCNACGRCCFNKRIQTNPYEVLRLARKLGMSTSEFMQGYLVSEGPYLQITREGACIFLDGKRCTVHGDQPLACRTYPLGRWVSGDGEETFRTLKPHPQTEGVYGREGTVERFLEQQGAAPYIAAADRYQELFYRLFDVLQRLLSTETDLAGRAEKAMFARDAADRPAFTEWLDVDVAVERYCTQHEVAFPRDIRGMMNLHIQSIDEWIDGSTGDAP
jgi:Fe-S-cluster containining protein